MHTRGSAGARLRTLRGQPGNDAAKACSVGDRKGRLATGFDADLLLINGDPLTDITALRHPAAVYVHGYRRV
jgi:imidazolonepropionase-like amidohydrolase